MKGAFLLLLLAFFVTNTLTSDICVGQYDGERLAHPYDCGKFIICRFEKTAETRNCPNGLHFNRQLGVCDLKVRAGCEIPLPGFVAAAVAAADAGCDCTTCCACCDCGGSGGSTTPTPSTPSECETEPTQGPTAGPTQGPTAGPTQGPTAGPTQGPTAGPTQGPTAGPTQGPTAGPTQGPTAGPTQGPTAAPTPSIPTPTPTGSPGDLCSNDLTSCIGKPMGTSMLYEGDCNRFIVCVDDCAVVQNCPENLQYNVKGDYCDYPEFVDCPWANSGPIGPTTGPSGISCTRPSICASKPEGSLLADSSNPNKFYYCQCECPIPSECPSGLVFNATANACDWASGQNSVQCQDGLIYNATSNQCDWPSGSNSGTGNANVICESSSTICKNEAEGALFPVDGSCNTFYKCNYGCAVEISCPNNLIYNSEKEYCDWPANVKCQWPYTPPSGPTAGPSGIACPSGGRCATQPEGQFLPSEKSCENYVVCQCNCEVEMPCPVGLRWDTNLTSCNYAANVTCSL